MLQDSEILCWDLRNPGHILFTTNRLVSTNQRVYFDLDDSGQYLLSGNHDGTVHVWDTNNIVTEEGAESEPLLQPLTTFTAHKDTVNGVK